MRKPGRSIVSVLISGSIFILALFLVSTWYLYFISSRQVLAHMSPGNEILPISVMVYGRGSDTISARFAFYSADWTILNTLERSWPGWEISLDSCIIQSGAGWIVLPLIIRTDQTRKGQGVELARYYDRSGFPAIYESPQITSRERKALKRLFSIARSGFPVTLISGRFTRKKTTLRHFEPGVEYFLYVDDSGNLSFR